MESFPLQVITRQEAAELLRQDASLLAGRSALQSPLWASFKADFGWRDYWFLPRGASADQGPLLVLLRRIAGPLALGYIPHPPRWAQQDAPRTALLSRELLGELPLGVFTLRWDWTESMEWDGEPPAGFRKAPMDIQPPSTTILSLEPGEEEILAGMKSKTRYNVRLAAKKGVSVAEEGQESLDEWYRLYQETARRDKIALHSLAYYRRLFELAWNRPGTDAAAQVSLRLYMARHDGEALAGIITLFYGEEAVYLYGASSSHKRNLMPAYALQWQAIRDARAAGCRRYDFFGIPPEGDDKEHPMHGLYRFKTGFGGALVHRPGSWDFPFSRLVYFFYRLAEKMRYYYHKKWKRR